MKTFIVIPTYNESENIVSLINDIFLLTNLDLSIIVVDDNSPDNTADLAETLLPKYQEKLFITKRQNKLGIGSAYISGFQKAISLKADLIMEMDADFSHNPKDIPKLISACEEGYDLAIGSRKIKGGKIIGWNIKRHIMSNGAMWFARLILNLKTKDLTAGFRCFKTNIFKYIDLNNIKSNGYAFQEELLYKIEKNNFKIKEVPVTFFERKNGISKLSSKDVLEFFTNMIKLRFVDPTKDTKH